MRIYRTLIKPLRFLWNLSEGAVGWAAFIASQFENGAAILSNERGDDAPERLGPRIVVFCHFDPQGRIRDHTRAYIDALCAEGLEMVFVTNSSRLAPPDQAWIRARAARIVVRRNVGHDFAAWRDAMAACGLPDEGTRFLLIANDSVYGPLRPLGPILAKIDFDEADLWSVTDSWQHRFHLQSFFVVFGPDALHHEAFAQFWGSVRNVRSKWWIVHHYEVGLSRIFMVAGLRCQALWPYIRTIQALRLAEAREDVQGAKHEEPLPRPLEPLAAARQGHTKRVLHAATRREPLNPMADLWCMLIEQGCPFLKRELLRKNPTRVPDVAAWLSLIDSINESVCNMIMRDLQLSLKNLSP